MLPRFGHHSCTTSSDGAAASIFNSQWDIPFRVLTIISVFGGVSVLPFMGVDIRLFSAIGGAAVLVLISVTFWYCMTSNTLVSLPEPEDVKQNRDEQRGDKEQAIHGPQQ